MRPDRHAGFALTSAIFLIVVLAALGAIIVTVAGLQQTSSARDVMGAKAYQAARAGIEWGAYRVLRQGGAADTPGTCFLPSPTVFAMPAGELSEFTVSVTCAVSTVDEGTRTGASALGFYVIVSTACNQPPCPNTTNPGAGYVERQLQASIAR